MTTTKDPKFDTPLIPAASAVFVVHSTTTIKAPASLVFRTLRNTETWKDWCRFVPRVLITYQSPDEDAATGAEISELVRNTSIASGFDSDLTEARGGAPAPVRTSRDSERAASPLRLPRNSTSSRISDIGGSGLREESPAPAATAPITNGLSGAHQFQSSQESRKASAASGATPAPISANMVSAPTTDDYLVPAPPNTASTAKAQTAKKRGSISAADRRAMSINAIYGEPSVRVQPGTRMIFFCRMKLPQRPREFKEMHMVVTEVSRPDDPVTEDPNLTALMRAKTHTLSRTGVYRIVWGVENTSSPSVISKGTAYPKFMLQTQRVHEIRPVYLGDGSEECEYRTWECQRGILAKTVKSLYGDYIMDRFQEWGLGLKEFCETMGGAVERRDFSVSY